MGAADEKGTEEEFELIEGEQPSVGFAVERMVEATQASINKAVAVEAEPETTDLLEAEAPSAFTLVPGFTLTPTITTTPTTTSTPTATPTPAATVDVYLDSGYPAPEEEVLEEMLPEGYPHTVAAAYEPPEAAIEMSMLDWIKALLAIAAIVTGFTSIYLRRKKQFKTPKN